MSIFNKPKTTTNGEPREETESKQETVFVERPRICCIDLTQADYETLKGDIISFKEL